ncbi:drug/metabolite transporter (DMT)-like permease [Desulfallas thermosapovorans DSM 6562]|uniref:Drug/metabolite transporter (DMT)-like permease n=2 Tax=Desulfallas thermosapovorans TaxID=58137 RepID=A0A5S4ZPL5_9FIRM|nr:drug/metabolite transporter (DMT)-like permease [Desulfallas thermosapovorans DSM 6562]
MNYSVGRGKTVQLMPHRGSEYIVMSQPLINPYLAVLLGVLASAFSSIFTKAAEAPPLVIALYRMTFTVLMLAPVTLVTGRHELQRLARRDILLACGAGIMLALHFAVWVTSLEYTSIASSTVLVTMQPLFVITGGYLFYKEKISRRGLLGAALALSGSMVVGISDFQVGGQALWGDLLAFLGAIFVAGYMLIGRGLRERLSLLPYIFVVFGSAAVTLFVAVLLFRLPLTPYPPATWLMFVLLAVVPTIMGHTVFNWALRYVKAAVVSVSILGEPVGATILAYFIFSQVPTGLQVAGGLIIITGLVIFIKSTAQSEK